nr:putative ribonuclease H-like domain-containing protein [Tanacetum cinerariifolium]
MANLSEDIQCAGFDTRPPMLDRTDFASWQQRIRLYCPERPRVYSDLSPKEKERYNANIRATNILLQGLPKDIYTLINHYTDAKDVWNNVKMLLEGSKLIKEDSESQLYGDFEYFRQYKGETIHDYYVRFAKLINDIRNIKMTMYIMQLNSKFINNMLPEWEIRGTMHGVPVQLVIGELRTELGMQIHVKQGRNGVALDEEQLLFIGGGQDNAVDEDVDEQPVQDLALNVDNVFQADDCDVFDFDVDEAPTAQTMFIVSLSSADPVYDEAGLSYDSDILSEVHDHDHYLDTVCEHHEVHEMHDDVQPNYVIDSHADYTSDSNMILYDHYVKDNAVPVVQINGRRSYVFEKGFKQKENKYLEEFLDMKALKEKVKDKLYKQDQSLQTVHVLCKPKPYYDEQSKVAIGYKNPLCLTCAKQVQSAQYNGHEIIKTNHVTAIVHNSEDTLEIAKIPRKKMKDPECVKKKVKIAPHDYSKENYLATFTPQTQLTPERIFWSKDLIKMKAEALKEQTPASRPIKASTVYPPNTPATLVSRVQSRGNMIRELREKISRLTKKHSDLDPIHDLKALDSQNKELHAKFNALHDLNEHWQAENEKVKRHYKELYDSIKITRAKTIEKTNYLLTEVANLKAQINENHKSNCIHMPAIKSKVFAHGMYVIDVEPIPPHNKNNREVYLDYLKHLKESVATLREIVEESMVKKPLDSSLSYACLYTKHSQELVEYVIGTCPKDFNKGDKQIASTPVTRKKRITFIDPCATAASGSKPRSNTKKDRTLPVKSDMKKVEVRPRNNKSSVKRKNHVDSSIRYKRTVKQVWLATGKSFATVGLGHNLFFVEQFCDYDLEVAFRKHSCYVRDTDGVELIKGSRGSNLYTILVEDMMESSPICLLSKSPRINHGYGTKDETPQVVIKFMKQIQDGLNKTVRLIRTDNGIEFVNKDLTEYYERVSIFHQKTVLRIPQQNGVVESRNRTLVEAARTMLIFSKSLMFLWAEAVGTACYTQNRSLIHTRHNKTPYELVHHKKPDLTFFRVFGALCYPTNDSEDLEKLQPTANIRIFGWEEGEGLGKDKQGIKGHVRVTNKQDTL